MCTFLQRDNQYPPSKGRNTLLQFISQSLQSILYILNEQDLFITFKCAFTITTLQQLRFIYGKRKRTTVSNIKNEGNSRFSTFESAQIFFMKLKIKERGKITVRKFEEMCLTQVVYFAHGMTRNDATSVLYIIGKMLNSSENHRPQNV